MKKVLGKKPRAISQTIETFNHGELGYDCNCYLACTCSGNPPQAIPYEGIRYFAKENAYYE